MNSDDNIHDWEKLIKRGHESRELDYKASTKWDEQKKKAACELVKDIVAMANHGGGWIIIGVGESGQRFDYLGVSESEISSYESTRLGNFVNKYVEPPINVRIHKPEIDGKQFVVIQVPGFPDTPHITKKDYPDVLKDSTIYVRTANNASEPIRSVSDFQGIVERAIRNRSDALLQSIQTILVHGQSKESADAEGRFQQQIIDAQTRCAEKTPDSAREYGYRETIFYPETFSGEDIALPELKKTAYKSSINFKGWPFLFADESRRDLISVMQDGIEGGLIEFGGEGAIADLHYWQLRQSGMVFVREILKEDRHYARFSSEIPKRFLSFERFSITAFEAIHCLTNVYESLVSESESISLNLRLTQMRGRVLRFSPERLAGEYECDMDTIEYSRTLSLTEWRAAEVDEALRMCRHVFERMNLDRPPLGISKELIEKALKKQL